MGTSNNRNKTRCSIGITIALILMSVIGTVAATEVQKISSTTGSSVGAGGIGSSHNYEVKKKILQVDDNKNTIIMVQRGEWRGKEEINHLQTATATASTSSSSGHHLLLRRGSRRREILQTSMLGMKGIDGSMYNNNKRRRLGRRNGEWGIESRNNGDNKRNNRERKKRKRKKDKKKKNATTADGIDDTSITKISNCKGKCLTGRNRCVSGCGGGNRGCRQRCARTRKRCQKRCRKTEKKRESNGNGKKKNGEKKNNNNNDDDDDDE